jgi:flagellar M-ring protein FliF
MAEAAQQSLSPMSGGLPDATSGGSDMSVLRQIGLMVGVAASVALGVALVLWSQEPEKRPLGSMDRATAYEVVNYLEQSQISYTVGANGVIMVDQSQYQKVQMDLAAQGISHDVSGDAILKQDSGFGVSQQLENARLVRSQEMNLSRTISQFSGVAGAQVHLAIPKETVFVNDRRKPSASVLLNLSTRVAPEREQIRAIVDLVAGSIPNLSSERITVTDQYGRLHHSGSLSSEESRTRQEFEEENRRQETLRGKIEQILAPILGVENFTVQANVDMDFTASESTSKMHNNDQPALRSQRQMQQSSGGELGAGGIPGALSNQPPGGDNIPEQLGGAQGAGASTASGSQVSERESNYELDTTISHTKRQLGTIRRISVSVGLNYRDDPTNPGTRVPLDADQVARIERLVRGVVNFDASRGDAVIVDSFDFPSAAPATIPPELAFYEQPLFSMLLKPGVALIGIILLIFMVFRPMISKLSTRTVNVSGRGVAAPELTSDQLSLGNDSAMNLPPPGRKSLAQVDRARSAVGDDPALVAQVVKNWMESDE